MQPITVLWEWTTSEVPRLHFQACRRNGHFPREPTSFFPTHPRQHVHVHDHRRHPCALGMNNKQAACLNCRKSKIKCRRDEGASVCERCEHVGVECVIPEFHIGRQKGVKK